ncbi:hypothetical protein [Jannaschia helgolandensis]|uniref:hypothetical protein n=1 Tax=Jannaschia helgolandensis TaxID=188906 RepID=UPI0030DD6D1F|tara:strand:+ start:2534 stop:3529 length:996 start_codon:yes stop_codon:yes gene_type:complete
MYNACLVIQKVSFDHIAHVVRFVHATLTANFGADTALYVCDEIDQADHPDNAIVFVIGEGFARHRRRRGCLYVYLNFSVVAVMGNPLRVSKEGWSAIRRKRRMLMDKLAGYDLLLDYFAPQTRVLQRHLRLPVLGFGIGVSPNVTGPAIALADRPYNVCFVGQMTPRRLRIIEDLRRRGLRMSPHSGIALEEVAAQSQCCINIHAHRSNHLETPRIIGALAVGTPVVTEKCYGLQGLLPSDLVKTARLVRLAEITQDICSNLDELQAQQALAQHWYRQTYLPQCRRNWSDICDHVKSLTPVTALPPLLPEIAGKIPGATATQAAPMFLDQS